MPRTVKPPIVLHGDPNDPFVSVDDMIRLLRLMGERDELKLSQLRRILKAHEARAPRD